MPGLVPGIHDLGFPVDEDVDGRDIGVLRTPFFERLCPAMTADRGRTQ
jgi:hypothetical protein